MSDYTIVLKHAFLLYFHNVYLDTEREIPFHVLEVFLSILKNLLDQFEYYSKKKYTDNEDNVESVEDFLVLTSNSYKSFGHWVQDYLLLLVQCFANIVRRNLNLIPDSEPARDYEKHMLNLVDYAQIAIEKHQTELITTRLARLIKEIFAKHSTGLIAEKIKDKHRNIILKENHEPAQAKKSPAASKYTSNRLQSQPGAGVSAFKKYEALIDLYFESEDFEAKCLEEFNLIVRELNSIEGAQEAGGASLTLEGFFRSLMAFLDPDHDHEDEEIYLMSLRILRRYLECSGSHFPDKSMAAWGIAEWKAHSSAVRPKQDKLVELGVVDLLCRVIRGMTQHKIVQENLLLGISLLFGGNLNAQAAFFSTFASDAECGILERLKQTLSESFEFIRKNMREYNALALKLFYVRFDANNSQKEIQEGEIERSRKLLEIRGEIERLQENHEICKSIFKFLQLLCEGHNKSLQNLLRQQNVESTVSVQKSINFVSLTAGVWGSYIKFVNPSCIDLGIAILDFVIESSQGPCELNQKEFYHNKIVDFSKDFMNDFSSERDFESRGFRGSDKEHLDALITQTIRMVNALLEANQDKQIYDYIGTNVDIGYLIKKLQSQFLGLFPELGEPDAYKTRSLQSLAYKMGVESLQKEFSEAFEIFFFIQNIEDSTGMYKKRLKELKGLPRTVLDFFAKNSGHIEIIFQNSIQKVYFMIHPICRFYDANQKRIFLDTVNRDTPNDKITDLMNQAPMIFDRMDHISILRARVGFVSEGSLRLIRDLCLLNILLINLYIFFTFRKAISRMEFKTISNSFTEVFFWVRSAHQIFGLLHILMSFLMIVAWFLLNSNLVLMDGWREKFSSYKKLMPSIFQTAKNSSAG